MASPNMLTSVDDQLFNAWSIQLVDRREGAIEVGSSLYLYRVTALPPF